MNIWLETLMAAALFAVGLWLSAFFSGSETGFYRLSHPRMSIDARAGDRTAQRLLWYAEHPAQFVATCLIGNNVANYLTTVAISWGVVLLFGAGRPWAEIGMTLAASPVIFLLGELVPKNVYYRAPQRFLRSEAHWFAAFFRLFLPITWPLVALTRLLERWAGQSDQPAEIVLGRVRLAQLLRHGHREGVLTDLQSRLASALLHIAPEPVTASMIPRPRILGVSETASRSEMLAEARAYGVSVLAVHRASSTEAWYGYVRVAELLGAANSPPTIHVMPQVSDGLSKLETLHQLQMSTSPFAAIQREGSVVGIVSRVGLVEQLFRGSSAAARPPLAPAR